LRSIWWIRTRGETSSSRWRILLRQSAYSRLVRYEDLKRCGARLSAAPTFRLIGSEKVWEWGVALTTTLHRLETDLLARGKT